MSASDGETFLPDPPPEAKRLQGIAYWALLVLGTLGVGLAINQTFNLKLAGFNPLGNSYLYYLIGIFLAAAFLSFPAWTGAQKRVPWYDWPLAVIALGTTIYLGINGLNIIEQGWEYAAPLEATLSSALLLVLILEGIRRCGGWPLLFVALFFGSYPLFAESMPGFPFAPT